MYRDTLHTYLNDHLAGASAGSRLARRIATRHSDSVRGADLNQVAGDIDQDRQTLLVFMDTLGVPVRRYKVSSGRVAELVGRLKLSGAICRPSGLSAVLELETLRLGVEGKALLWRTLRAVASKDSRLSVSQIEGLLARAEQQIDVLERLRMTAAVVVFSP
ncbi:MULTISPECIES: hypothetical protein [unclassified Streptomyces]|uniref:hypothetical protein n=1 Tax=unclassified Streptomyces TaxID=2593676 RepID=UPI000CDA6088|nr:hypothetical protein [Streptomyces sp. SM10]